MFGTVWSPTVPCMSAHIATEAVRKLAHISSVFLCSRYMSCEGVKKHVKDEPCVP